MTVLIQQKTGHDCVLAAIAMAAGCSSWEELWTAADLETVVAKKGIANEEPWLKRAGFLEGEHYRCIAIFDQSAKAAGRLLWKRRALISCSSLNNLDGSHMVYWDGNRVWDPHEGHWHLGWQYYKHITSLKIEEVILFDDTIPLAKARMAEVATAEA